MTTLAIAIIVPLLAAATVWIWYCRDPGPNSPTRSGNMKAVVGESEPEDRS